VFGSGPFFQPKTPRESLEALHIGTLDDHAKSSREQKWLSFFL
jgi:hypothetical protein